MLLLSLGFSTALSPNTLAVSDLHPQPGGISARRSHTVPALNRAHVGGHAWSQFVRGVMPHMNCHSKKSHAQRVTEGCPEEWGQASPREGWGLHRNH